MKKLMTLMDVVSVATPRRGVLLYRALLSSMVSSVAVVSHVIAADLHLQWQQGVASFADGAVTATYSGGLVSELALSSGGNRLWIDGAQTIAFASDAQVLIDGEVVIDVPMTASGRINFAIPDEVRWMDGVTEYLPQSEADAVVVAEGVSLDDYRIQYACCGHNELGYYYGSYEPIARAYFVERSSGTLSCQIQHVADTRWTKCVFLHLKQSGNQILAWTPRVYYADVNTAPLGTDFRVAFSGRSEQTVSNVRAQRSGYGIDGISLLPLSTHDVKVTAGLKGAGTLAIGPGLEFEASGPGALTDEAVWPTALVLDGTFRVANPDGVELSGTVSYGTFGRFEIVSDADIATNAFSCAAPDLPGGNWMTVTNLMNCRLSQVTNITAGIGGGTWFGSRDDPLTPCFLENDGELLTIQFHRRSDYLKGVVYQLRQAGPYIQARILKAAYTDVHHEVGTFDLRNGNDIAIYTGGEEGYGLDRITVHFADNAKTRSVILSGQAVTTRDSGRLVVESDDSAPMNVIARNRALHVTTEVSGPAKLAYEQGSPFGSSLTSLLLHDGGEYFSLVDWEMNENEKLVIDGGRFRASPLVWSPGTSSVYLNYVTLSNGGRLTDNPPRTGYYLSPVWSVRGETPSRIDAGLGIVGHGTTARTITFDVLDVTGDVRPDLFIAGPLYYSNPQWINAQVTKSGAGTLRHEGTFSVSSFPLLIQAGVWETTSNEAFAAGCDIQFGDGTWSVADGCSETIRTLVLTNGTHGRLVLGAGASININSLSADGDFLLDITSGRDDRVRIGTTQCLTAEQCRHITMNGARVIQDREGYLTLKPSGTMILVL